MRLPSAGMSGLELTKDLHRHRKFPCLSNPMGGDRLIFTSGLINDAGMNKRPWRILNRLSQGIYS